MLREETAKLLMMIQGAYPNYKPDNKTVTINTWNLALSDISFDLAQKAFLAYLRADTKGFAPTPGQLIALVRELNTPKQLNELEAWSLVEKAIRNSIYNSQEEFSKLPPLVQKAGILAELFIIMCLLAVIWQQICEKKGGTDEQN